MIFPADFSIEFCPADFSQAMSVGKPEGNQKSFSAAILPNLVILLICGCMYVCMYVQEDKLYFLLGLVSELLALNF